MSRRLGDCVDFSNGPWFYPICFIYPHDALHPIEIVFVLSGEQLGVL
jgi:hypothetical protein